MTDHLTFLIPEMQRQSELLRDSILLRATKATELMRVSQALDGISRLSRSELDELHKQCQIANDMRRMTII